MTTREIMIRAAAASDVGRVRCNNEDAFSMWDLSRGKPLKSSATLGPLGALLAVCDGMGGAAAGEVASRIAAEALGKRLSCTAVTASGHDLALALVRAVVEAGREIRRDAEANPSRAGMGTTVTACLVRGGDLFVAQVGDSRAYLMRSGVLTQLTRDQTLSHHLLERGVLSAEEASRKGPGSNVILQALGSTVDVSVELSLIELCDGDRLLLCSDGLSGLVSDDQVASVVAVTDDLSIACKRLLDMANRAGGDDNITALLCDLSGDALPRSSEPVVISPFVIGKTKSSELAMAEDDLLPTSHWRKRRGSMAGLSPTSRWLAVLALLVLAVVVLGAQLDLRPAHSSSGRVTPPPAKVERWAVPVEAQSSAERTPSGSEDSTPASGILAEPGVRPMRAMPEEPASTRPPHEAGRERNRPRTVKSSQRAAARRAARPHHVPVPKPQESGDETAWKEDQRLFGLPFD